MAHGEGGEHRQVSFLGLLLDVHVVRGGVRARRRLRPPVARRRRQRGGAPHVGHAVPHQGALALRVRGHLLLDLEVGAREVLVAAHVELQAEVAGGGEGAEFTLERLAAVLVLMDLRRGRFWLRRWEKACVFFFWGGVQTSRDRSVFILSSGPEVCGVGAG